MEDLKLKYEAKVGGRFKLQITDKDGNTRDATDWFDNIVLDQGLNRMGTGAWFQYCHVGSSNVAPTTTQTSLQGFVASTSTTNGGFVDSYSGTSPYYRSTRRTFRFAAGTLNNVNLSEVGFGWDSTASSLFNRALIKDSNGNPTTITVLNTDVLDVICECRVYMYEGSDVVNNVNLGLSTHTFTSRSVDVNTNATVGQSAVGISQSTLYKNASFAAVTSTSISGTQLTATASTSGNSQSNATYANNSLKRVTSISIGLNNGNDAAGISGITLYHNSFPQHFQILISPPIMKTSTRTLSLNFEISWDRYVP